VVGSDRCRQAPFDTANLGLDPAAFAEHRIDPPTLIVQIQLFSALSQA
jgi:hypothetical protein